jgi:hypothetical protein
VRHQKPLPAFVLENVGHEGIEAYGLAVLTQQLDPFHAYGPCRLSIDANVRLVHRNGDAIELAKTHLPGLAHTFPADHDRGAQRTDERGVALVCPHLVHRVDVTRADRGNKLLARSGNALKIAALLSLHRRHGSEQQT